MLFSEKLNEYIDTLGCTAKDVSEVSGISAASLSRYRSGKGVPVMDAPTFKKLCTAIALIADLKGISELSEDAVKDGFIDCSDFISTDKEQLRRNFNSLIAVLGVNLSNLCRYANYDVSTVFRIRTGVRQPADPDRFAESVASYIAQKFKSDRDLEVIAGLIGLDAEKLRNHAVCFACLKSWLLEGQAESAKKSGVGSFLTRLDEFDLNEYIQTVRFDELKIPTVPFRMPESRFCSGFDEMMDAELAFLEATVKSHSTAPVILYSDLPMGETSKDPEFTKKRMLGIFMLLKKGLHVHNIHNIDRSFDELMLGLESRIPMYMTGQLTPYYLKGPQSSAFHHFLRVSGAAAITGEAVCGRHAEGRCYLSNTKEDIAYCTRRAEALLEIASPLMDIYRADRADRLAAFLLADSGTPGKHRSTVSAPPLDTRSPTFLEKVLKNHGVDEEKRTEIMRFADVQRENAAKILAHDRIEDDILCLREPDFNVAPVPLPLSGMFFDEDIRYTWDEYREHMRLTGIYAQANPAYTAEFTASGPFKNLQLIMHEGKWAMISKGNAPEVHFVIHHPKLRSAIESFIPPLVEG